MKRRDTFRLIPLTLAGIGGLVQKVAALEHDNRSGNTYDQLPLALQYPKNIMNLLKWVQENQSENMLETAYAISRTIRNGRTCWVNWDQGHSTTADMFPERNGVPQFINLGYDPKRSQKGDIILLSRILSQSQYDDIVKKDIFVVGSPSPWSGDAIGFENVRKDIQINQIRRYADIWIDTPITSFGGMVYIPGMPSPTGPVSGPLCLTILWMMIADACRILSIEGESVKVAGDEPTLSGDNIRWENPRDPLMDNFLDEVMREMELIGAELGNLREIAKMAVDTLLDGGTVYWYSRYRSSFASNATGRRAGFAFSRGISDGSIEGTSKDCVIMGTYKPDDDIDLKNLDEFKKRGMRISSIGPITRDYKIPEGRTVYKETESHIGRMTDTYGLYAIQGIDKKVCPTSGILNTTLLWSLSMEIIEQIRERTGGNVPGINFSGALDLSRIFTPRIRAMQQDRGY